MWQIVLLLCCASHTLSFQTAYNVRSNVHRKNLDLKASSVVESEQPSTPTSPVTLKAFRGLTSDLFSHPLDKAVIKQLKQIPLIETVIRRLFVSVESGFIMENLGNSLLVGPKQMPGLHFKLQQACKVLDIETVPDLYVKQTPIPNAYTLAFMGRRPFIVVHTGLLDLLNEDEITAVIGHELGHMKCEHGLWISLFNVITQAANEVFPSVLIPLVVRDLTLQWQRSAELSCDRAALLVAQGDYRSVASVIMKLVGGSSKNEYCKDLSLDAFLEQAEELDKEEKLATRRGPQSIARQMGNRMTTHPLPLLRAKELVAWAGSAQYQGLMARSQEVTMCAPSNVGPPPAVKA